MQDLKIKAKVEEGTVVVMKTEDNAIRIRIIQSEGLLGFGEAFAFVYHEEKVKE